VEREQYNLTVLTRILTNPETGDYLLFQRHSFPKVRCGVPVALCKEPVVACYSIRVSTRSARASEDEKEFLPVFMHLIGFNKLVLDLAGGYGRIAPYLMENNNTVVSADLSPHSLPLAKKTIRRSNLHIVCMDLLHLPFIDNVFDGVWFTQAFEYVPPDESESFLRALKGILKAGGFVFLNVAKVPNECSRFSYLKNYLYWRLIKRQSAFLLI